MLSADLEVVAGDYFSTFKAPLLRGRTLNERDTKDSPRVIVVDQAMVDKYFPGEDPIGKRLMVDAGNDEEGNVASEIVGVVAPTLATIGLYGLLAYSTLKRVREIGVRLALGARPSQILTLILSHGMQLLLVGSAIGLAGAIAVSHFLQRLLFEVGGVDPRIYLEVGAVLLSATFLACWIPARRASRVDPIVALRTE